MIYNNLDKNLSYYIMELITLILSSSSVGIVIISLAYYIFRRCKTSECNAHIADAQGNHIDISIGTPHVEATKEAEVV